MSVNRQILYGATWVVAARWGIRGIGLVSTLILVRLLAPQDFGIIAMAMIFVGFVEVFGDTGLYLYLIRHKDPQRSDFDTVWTLRLMVGSTLAAIVFFSAPLASQLFNEAKIEAVLPWLALRPLMVGLENPGVVWFRKNMDFNRDFRILVLNKVVSFAVGITLAFLLRSYWALVFGMLAGGASALVQSYIMHPYRPRFDLSRTRQAWGYSIWILSQTMTLFLTNRLDEIVIGRLRSTSDLGYYTIANDVGASPLQEVVTPIGRVLFPGFVKLADDPKRLAESFAKVLSGVAIAAFSISVGMALIAHDFVYIFLGEPWLRIVPLMQSLALSMGVFALSEPVFTLLGTTGQVRLAAGLSFARLLALAVAIIPTAIHFDMEAIAIARLLAMAATTALVLHIAARRLTGQDHILAKALFRPAVAALVMAAIVDGVIGIAPDIPALRMAMAVATGATAFGGSLIGLWWLQKQPAGIESDIIGLIRRRIGHRG